MINTIQKGIGLRTLVVGLLVFVIGTLYALQVTAASNNVSLKNNDIKVHIVDVSQLPPNPSYPSPVYTLPSVAQHYGELHIIRGVNSNGADLIVRPSTGETIDGVIRDGGGLVESPGAYFMVFADSANNTWWIVSEGVSTSGF